MAEKEVVEDFFPDGPSELGHEGDQSYLRVFCMLFGAGVIYLALILLEVL